MVAKNYQRICVAGYIKNKDGKILVVKRSKNENFLPNIWELPGGGMEQGENIEDTVKREIKEECGLNVEVGIPLSVNSYYLNDIQRIEILFFCTALNDQSITLSEEHSSYQWILLSKLNTINLSIYIITLLERALKNPSIKNE